ncbi:hypothetical protein QCE62_05555 [Caballeronia sp. LZ033]|uniref:hypothetical protein n=1 Tax=Caballeronia sp. LZ033 TaxID=3038566 RepID=UPI00286569FB|nr:hypothetical protein [Caballeronia sp. LZ033]MDR5813055.1 hypothetical protein [Caballeronia sp. LZ033]
MSRSLLSVMFAAALMPLSSFAGAPISCDVQHFEVRCLDDIPPAPGSAAWKQAQTKKGNTYRAVISGSFALGVMCGPLVFCRQKRRKVLALPSGVRHDMTVTDVQFKELA